MPDNDNDLAEFLKSFRETETKMIERLAESSLISNPNLSAILYAYLTADATGTMDILGKLLEEYAQAIKSTINYINWIEKG